MGILVSDLDASIRFYEALTGTKIANKDASGGPRMASVQGLDKVLIRYANVHPDNINIDLLQYEETAPKKASYAGNEIGAMHLCFEVDDLDAEPIRLLP
ncbi:VOC family protein [Microvirga arsenatis]|uniref:VOC family protein n=1 Tax=Microvirga arsenatis TaxID=2692265 RepID=UPI0031B6405A